MFNSANDASYPLVLVTSDGASQEKLDKPCRSLCPGKIEDFFEALFLSTCSGF